MQAARRVKKEAMVEKEEQTVRDQAKCRYVTPQSQKLLTQLKPRAFKQMFDALDTDKVRNRCTIDFSLLLAREDFSTPLMVDWHFILCQWRHVPSDQL